MNYMVRGVRFETRESSEDEEQKNNNPQSRVGDVVPYITTIQYIAGYVGCCWFHAPFFFS